MVSKSTNKRMVIPKSKINKSKVSKNYKGKGLLTNALLGYAGYKVVKHAANKTYNGIKNGYQKVKSKIENKVGITPQYKKDKAIQKNFDDVRKNLEAARAVKRIVDERFEVRDPNLTTDYKESFREKPIKEGYKIRNEKFPLHFDTTTQQPSNVTNVVSTLLPNAPVVINAVKHFFPDKQVEMSPENISKLNEMRKAQQIGTLDGIKKVPEMLNHKELRFVAKPYTENNNYLMTNSSYVPNEQQKRFDDIFKPSNVMFRPKSKPIFETESVDINNLPPPPKPQKSFFKKLIGGGFKKPKVKTPKGIKRV